MEDMVEFRQKVRAYYEEDYAKNDLAHQMDHADGVVEGGLIINRKLKLKVDEKLIILAGYMHDIFTGAHRKEHHTLAYDYVMKIGGKLWNLSRHETKLVANAVKEHRSSGDGIFTSTLSEIIAAADKGRPDLTDYILRSFKYHLKTESKDEAYKNVLEHLKEKFSSTGYATYPDLYAKFYGDDLKHLQKQIDDLTLKDVIKIVKDNE